jgi:hypothetical protein
MPFVHNFCPAVERGSGGILPVLAAVFDWEKIEG